MVLKLRCSRMRTRKTPEVVKRASTNPFERHILHGHGRLALLYHSSLTRERQLDYPAVIMLASIERHETVQDHFHQYVL